MIVEQQGLNECGLSTMAALSGRSLAEVRVVADGVAKLAGTAFYYSSVLHRIAETLDPSGHLAMLCQFYRGFVVEGQRADTTGAKTACLLSSRTRTLPRNGRGVVRFHDHHRMGHVVPWENGLVYPTESPAVGLSLREYRKCFPLGWHVDYITHEKEGSE